MDKLCENHWQFLKRCVATSGLGPACAKDKDEADALLADGRPDPLTAAYNIARHRLADLAGSSAEGCKACAVDRKVAAATIGGAVAYELHRAAQGDRGR